MAKKRLYKDSIDEITSLIKAGIPIIWMQTHEENRFIGKFVEEVAEPNKRQVWLWSAYQGLIRQDRINTMIDKRASGSEEGTHNPQRALQNITNYTNPKGIIGSVFIMRDMHTVLSEPIPRQLRDIYEHLIDNNKTIIITSPIIAHGPGGTRPGLPPTLEKQITVLNFELPNQIQITARIHECVTFMKSSTAKQKIHLDYSDTEINTMVRGLQGLTMIEVDDATSTSLAHKRRLDHNHLLAAKKQLIRKSEILEYIESPYGLDEVGGMDQAKEYLQRYGMAYSDKAKQFGVEPLKGIILTGIPGSGKSLLAKIIGNLWKVPLLKLDVGKVMNGLVGSSESKMREVIQQAETMAPCILWLDEVEKSLSGTKSSNFSDGGTMARVFGTLLTAMQDGLDGVTIVATANDITMLPPEFIRRFNEVFFVDLPSPDERWDIFKIHLEKRGRKLSLIQKSKNDILAASDKFTGAEIEKAIKDAIAEAFYSKQDNLNASNIINALQDTKPIAVVMGTKIRKLREKARGQYRYASSQTETQAKTRTVSTKKGKSLNLNDALDDFSEIKKKPVKKSTKKTNRFSNVIQEDN